MTIFRALALGVEQSPAISFYYYEQFAQKARYYINRKSRRFHDFGAELSI